MKVSPYLMFEGRCEEALAFYRTALGAEVIQMLRYKDFPGPANPEMNTPPDKVMHSSFRVGETVVMAADGHCSGKTDFQGFSLALTPADGAEAERVFAALADGGEVKMPLSKTF